MFQNGALSALCAGNRRAGTPAPGKSRSSSTVDHRVAERCRPHPQIEALNLALARLAAQLADDLERLAPAVGVPLREVAAARVHRQLAAQLDPPAGDPVGRLARRAETEALEGPEHLRREAVVAVERPDLGGRHA